nr:hypothetical protein [Candidatus Pelagisphaera phototrophica]
MLRNPMVGEDPYQSLDRRIWAILAATRGYQVIPHFVGDLFDAFSRFLGYSRIVVQRERYGGLAHSGPFGDISERRLFIWPMIIGVFIHLAKNLRGG